MENIYLDSRLFIYRRRLRESVFTPDDEISFRVRVGAEVKSFWGTGAHRFGQDIGWPTYIRDD